MSSDAIGHYTNEHLKLQVDQWVTTSFGIAFTRSAD